MRNVLSALALASLLAAGSAFAQGGSAPATNNPNAAPAAAPAAGDEKKAEPAKAEKKAKKGKKKVKKEESK